MNITIGSSTSNNTFKQLKAQYIAAACGLALALGAIAGVSAWRDGGASAPDVPARAPISVSTSERAGGRLTVFIAGSQQQASDHAASLYQDLNPNWYGTYTYVVASDDEAAADLVYYGQAQAAIENPDLHFRIVDLRVQSLTPATPSKDQRYIATNSLLDAVIMASVLSTELATWNFDQTSLGASGASAADLYASESAQEYAAREASQTVE